MKHIFITLILTSMLFTNACTPTKSNSDIVSDQDTFQYYVERFADVQILCYNIPGFESLSLDQKKLVYYLSEAAKCGRDIFFDQNNKYNLTIRRTLTNIVNTYKGDRNTEAFSKFMLYTKRVWFSNGIHHHYSSDKFIPTFTQEDFKQFVSQSDLSGFPITDGLSLEQWMEKLIPIMFDPNIYSKKVSLDTSKDIIKESATNFYEGVSEKEAVAFYDNMKDPNDPEPISYGLNSKLVKENGKVVEKVWKSGAMYGPAIDKIIYWLEKAATVAESSHQKQVIEALVKYYRTGDLKDFDAYNLLWVKDDSNIDFINGFIEVYGDPMALRGSWEANVNFKNIEATKRTQILSKNAQWFEDNSPIDSRFKKKEVKGVSAKVITVAQLGGDSYPSTPIGINLPNADWIRKSHGSKSVTIENITYAYGQVSLGSGELDEFAANETEKELMAKWGNLSNNLHTDMHECLGHGSGQLLPGVSTDAMKNYHNTLEEARADLFALYFMGDEKMVELGLIPTLDVAYAEYYKFLRNGLLTQLSRIELGNDIQESHMRDRKLISEWCLEKGSAENVVEKVVRNGKTYIQINDMQKLRGLFGQLLSEVQRIKSEGDYDACKNLIETYAVKVDPVLHKEILERYESLHIAPYSGFINPILTPVLSGDEIVDVKVEYPKDFIQQHLDYDKNYSFLPTFN